MDIMQIIINGGSVGVAVYCLYIIEKVEGNHLNHLTSALNKNTDILHKLEIVINRLIDKLK